MNKEELIKFKKILETKIKYSSLLRVGEQFSEHPGIEGDYYYQGPSRDIITINNKKNTKEAIKAITNNFETAIYYCCKNEYEFDKLIISPCLCPFVNTKDIKKHEEDDDEIMILEQDAQVLEDIIELDLYDIKVINNVKEIIIDPELIPGYITGKWFTVSKTSKEALKNNH